MDVVQVVLMDQEQRVLMGLRQNVSHSNNLWAFPGGRVEGGESLAAAAQRECLEEIGVCPTQLSGPISMTDPDGNHLHYFLCQRWQGQARNLEPGLCAKLDWFSVMALPAPRIAQAEQVVNLLQHGQHC